MGQTSAVTDILTALITGGLLSFARDAWRAWKTRQHAHSPEGMESARVASANDSLLVVVKARDELEEDNRRLRETITEERARAAEDRAQAALEKSAMRAEIDSLEAKLRAMLTEVEALKNRHAE